MEVFVRDGKMRGRVMGGEEEVVGKVYGIRLGKRGWGREERDDFDGVDIV